MKRIFKTVIFVLLCLTMIVTTIGCSGDGGKSLPEQDGSLDAMMASVMLDALLDVSRGPVDSTPLPTTAFPDAPDSIVLYQDGKAIELMGEDAVLAYAKFMPMMASVGVFTYRHQIHPIDMIEQVLEHICVEFRYCQRRSFTGTVGEPNALSSTYSGYEYDALLFVMSSADEIRQISYMDGEYRVGPMTDQYWVVDAQAFSDFQTHIAVLLPK